MNLPAGLSAILADGIAPAIARWAVAHERRILKEGSPLAGALKAFAEEVGISRPEGIRVLVVNRIPLPVPVWMTEAGRKIGLPVFHPVGMALGRGIYLLPGQEASLPHELIHILQYEREGGIEGFMKLYLRQCFEVGYHASALEEEARTKGFL